MKIVKYLAFAIVGIFGIVLYSGMVNYYSTGGTALGFLREPILRVSTFPYTVKEVLTSYQVTGVSDTYVEVDPQFEEINKMDYDLFVLNSFWNDKVQRWDLKLLNLRNDSVLREWKLEFKPEVYKPIDMRFSQAVPRDAMLLDNNEVLVQLVPTPNLMRLDSNANIIWINQDVVFHHSLNLNHDSTTVWATTYSRTDQYKISKKSQVRETLGIVVDIDDDYLTEIDVKTGKTLFHKSLTEILVENGYIGQVFGHMMEDALHLNDIQPVLEDGEYWNKGDLFLSLRNRSLVFLYRPSTNKIVKLLTGPFLNQHDVDIISDKEISIFSNNTIFYYQYDPGSGSTKNLKHDIKSSEVIVYNFETNQYSSPFKKGLEQERIWTETEGLAEVLSNGHVYVEQQNDGKMYILDRDNNFVLKKTLATEREGYVFTPTWIRIYEKLND